MTPIVFLNGRSGVFGGKCASETTTKKLQDHLRHSYRLNGYHLSYPRTQARHWYSRRGRHLLAGYLLPQVKGQSGSFLCDIVAHSLGADAVREIMEFYPTPLFRRIILLSPATSHKINWSPYLFERMLVIHNPRDRAILAGGLLPGHRFGFAGRKGYIVPDKRLQHVTVEDSHKLDLWKHSHYFEYPTLVEVGKLVSDFICAR